MKIIEALEKEQMRADLPEFRVGDTLSVHEKIVEEGKERIQIFTGYLIARKGSGIRQTITLRRESYGRGVEKSFLVHSPRVAQIEVKRHGAVRRSKLYYLRRLQGKKARIKEVK